MKYKKFYKKGLTEEIIKDIENSFFNQGHESQIKIDSLDICHIFGYIEEKDKEIERLNNIIEEIQHKAYLGMKENENKTNEFQQAFTVAYRYIYNEINKLKELKEKSDDNG